jgi:hypothetical protein
MGNGSFDEGPTPQILGECSIIGFVKPGGF